MQYMEGLIVKLLSHPKYMSILYLPHMAISSFLYVWQHDTIKAEYIMMHFEAS
jgi:hypothetical protein